MRLTGSQIEGDPSRSPFLPDLAFRGRTQGRSGRSRSSCASISKVKLNIFCACKGVGAEPNAPHDSAEAAAQQRLTETEEQIASDLAYRRSRNRAA
jgi:hypothetical protein